MDFRAKNLDFYPILNSQNRHLDNTKFYTSQVELILDWILKKNEVMMFLIVVLYVLIKLIPNFLPSSKYYILHRVAKSALKLFELRYEVPAKS